MQQMQAEQSMQCITTQPHTPACKKLHVLTIYTRFSPVCQVQTHIRTFTLRAHTHTLTGIPIGAAACTWKITVLLTRQHQLCAWGQRERGCRERERHGGTQTKQPRFFNKNNILNSLIRESLRDSTSLTDKCRNSLLDMHEWDLLTTETN